MQDMQHTLEALLVIAERAGKEILEVYARPDAVQVEYKADDSPLTEADTRANTLIVQALRQLSPDTPVLSEENVLPPFAERGAWQEYWLIDPLDGTKEFVSRNGEFTVNIALIRDGVPVLGVVHAPVLGVSWLGVPGAGAWKCATGEPWQAIHTASLPTGALRVVASRRHGAEALDLLLQRLGRHFPQVSLLNKGSSLKFCLLAEGSADLYPRLAPTSEWDTAAAQAVLVAAGGAVLQEDLQTLRYNAKADILNPSFLAVADAGADWAGLLA
jgi:3'(2'), 5'-bisphosphate nucleotidase